MLAINQLVAEHSPSGKVLHYVKLRVRESDQLQTYRAGSFVPGSKIDAVIFDLALVYDAALSVSADSWSAESHLRAACTAAAEELSERRLDISNTVLMARAKAVHIRYVASARDDLRKLSEAVEQLLLPKFAGPGRLTLAQEQLRRDLALVLALEAQVVHSSVLCALGVQNNLSLLIDDRDQHLYLFCNRYGCINKAEFGEEPDDNKQPLDIPLPNDFLKRLMDVVASALIIIGLSPLFVFIYLAIKKEKGPALYSQKRVGHHGKIFNCWKFRTMVPHAESLLEQILADDEDARTHYAKYFKLRNDPRITPIGRFLRSTSFDELPQLFNVLKGEMTLVGPRPIAFSERDRWGSYFRIYKSLRPGLTGPWQLYFRSDFPYDLQFEHVALYAKNWSLFRDIRYLFETLTVPFKRRGAY